MRDEARSYLMWGGGLVSVVAAVGMAMVGMGLSSGISSGQLVVLIMLAAAFATGLFANKSRGATIAGIVVSPIFGLIFAAVAYWTMGSARLLLFYGGLSIASFVALGLLIAGLVLGVNEPEPRPAYPPRPPYLDDIDERARAEAYERHIFDVVGHAEIGAHEQIEHQGSRPLAR